MCARVCETVYVCVCVRACVRVCVCVRVIVCLCAGGSIRVVSGRSEREEIRPPLCRPPGHVSHRSPHAGRLDQGPLGTVRDLAATLVSDLAATLVSDLCCHVSDLTATSVSDLTATLVTLRLH